MRGLPLLIGEAQGVGADRWAAGVGDVDVDRAEVSRDGGDEAVDRAEVVAVEGVGLAVDGAGGGTTGVRVTRGDRDTRALGSQRRGDPVPDAARTTGDQRDLAVESEVHGRSLSADVGRALGVPALDRLQLGGERDQP